MKIVIAGMGMVGYNLAKSLSTEDNDITCIDISPDAATLAEDSLDVLSVQGNSASISVQSAMEAMIIFSTLLPHIELQTHATKQVAGNAQMKIVQWASFRYILNTANITDAIIHTVHMAIRLIEILLAVS